MDGQAGVPARGVRDLRAYARGTGARLIAGALFLLFVVGGGLIFIFYGSSGAALGLGCLLAAMVPVVLIVVGLAIMDRVVRSERGRG